MTRQVAVDDVGGVRVGVEVHDADVAVAVHVRHGGGSGPRDRVITAEDDRDDATGCDLMYPLADVGVADLGLAVWAIGIAIVHDLEVLEDLDVEIDVVGAGLVDEGPDRPGTEAGARSIGRGDVERRPNDRDVGLPGVELLGVGEERPLTEGRQAAEDIPELELLVHPGGEIAAWFVHRVVP